jgi:APA family basic amino acid/polyamine antiporter
MSLLIRKPLSALTADLSDGEHSLKRSLGPGALVGLGVGAIIGAGLFSLTGIAAANNAGPAVVLSFVLAAIGCAFAGMCYSEFSTMIPIAGSAYTYAYATMGELIAWIIGWDLVLEYGVGAATVSISWSSYVVSLLHDFGINLPAAFIASPWQPVTLPDGTVVYGAVNLPAVLIVCALSLLLMIGIRESARINEVMVVLKVSVVLIFIIGGWAYMNSANHTPFIPPNTGKFGEFGYSGVIRAAGIIFFAFIGFDAVSTAAQEARNPQKHMPIGIIGSLAICTLLYVLFAWVMTGLRPYTAFKDSAAPVAVAIAATPYTWLATGVKFAIVCGYTSVILVMLLGQSRVFFSMSRDGLLPKLFSAVHHKFRTPWRSNLLFLVFVSLFSGFAPISVVGEMTSIGTLFAFVIVCAGIIVMRRTQPDIHRPFRTPLVPLVPVLGVLANLGLMLGLGAENWARLIIWMGIGLAIYFGYSRKRSKVRALEQVPSP